MSTCVFFIFYHSLAFVIYISTNLYLLLFFHARCSFTYLGYSMVFHSWGVFMPFLPSTRKFHIFLIFWLFYLSIYWSSLSDTPHNVKLFSSCFIHSISLISFYFTTFTSICKWNKSSSLSFTCCIYYWTYASFTGLNLTWFYFVL